MLMQMPSAPPPARRRKGSQVKGATTGSPASAGHPDFSRILGYMGEEAEEAMAAEPDVKPAVGKGAPREETPWEDVPDRDYIKHRTMKVGHLLAADVFEHWDDTKLRTIHVFTTAVHWPQAPHHESRPHALTLCQDLKSQLKLPKLAHRCVNVEARARCGDCSITAHGAAAPYLSRAVA